ncbi:M23 family metallopeptidase [Altererythrobacter sp. SALINAS58]|uniref:M23 family metallopeptidase n=1 Tax=Alteripontixanthobacter muriae TaxID=2705546 RepID=UPI00157776FE|nr:M23 family metallopeptidase [Alteripontixanthobacter muriae]NTZ42321.1 M23 family metallopeptidase [Alteripontixanthobacter muriae]
MRRIAPVAVFAAVLLSAPPALASDPATETSHVVQEGETLNGIANRARVPAAVIAAANGLQEPYSVRLGQKLIIPRQRSHKVREGDTGLSIARRYGVPFRNIAIANRLEEPYEVQIGQVLIIPAVVKAPQTVAARERPYFRAPHDGEIMLGFAVRPDGGGHDGLDFAADAGDMVRAAANGTVVFAGNEPERFGRMVVIDHGQGWRSVYGHLERITVSAGHVVKSGERVGIAGDAGEAERVELHFEVRRDGRPVDPAPLLAGEN